MSDTVEFPVGTKYRLNGRAVEVKSVAGDVYYLETCSGARWGFFRTREELLVSERISA